MHPPEFTSQFALLDEEATRTLGGVLAALLEPGLVIFLEGDLGAGKTTLVRAMLRSLGYVGPVKSPTYSLVEFYVVSSLYCYHFDFYRFESPEEFADAGLDEAFRGDAVCLVEWPDKARGYLPEADLCLRLEYADSGRILSGMAYSRKGGQCLSELSRIWPEDGSSARLPELRSSSR